MRTIGRVERRPGARRQIVVGLASFGATVAVLALAVVLGTSLANRPASSDAGSGQATTRKAATVPTQRWLVPDAEYAKIRPAPPQAAAAAQPEQARPAAAAQITANGPVASRLLDRLTKAGIASMLPANHPTPTVEDQNAGGSPAIGGVTYAFADDSLISVTQQQLMRPLPYSVVGVYGTAEPLQRPNGTQLVVNHGASFVQVVMVSSTGVLTQVTARGVPAQNVPIPMTEVQVRALAEAMDRSM